VLALPADLSREEHRATRQAELWDYGGIVFKFVFSHAKLGGVTEAWWRFLFFVRAGEKLKPDSWLLGSKYERTLQTVLDNTIVRGTPPDSLVDHSPDNDARHHGAWCMVLPRGRKKALPVYDGGGVLPKLHTFRRGAAAYRP
jgi:hypothetical protein